MRRRTKGLVVVAIILVITIPTVLFILNMFYPPSPEPFNLEDAPAEILLIKDDLKTKLSEGSFAWNDLDDLITISQYIADNSPLVEETIQGWDKTTVFNVTDSGYFWFITQAGLLTIFTGPTPPIDFDIKVTPTLDSMTLILSQEETAVSSFQKGNLDFTGPLGDALKVDRLTQIIASTLMDTSIEVVETSLELFITEDKPSDITFRE